MTNILTAGPRAAAQGWSPLTNDNLQPGFPDSVIVQWLASAYGTTEAERIVALPNEIRDELYSELVKNGPAGDEIAKVVDMTRTLLLRPNGVWVDKQLRFIGRSAGYSSLRTRICRENDLVFLTLNKQLMELTAFLEQSAPWKRSDNQDGLLALMWALNAQHPYFRQAAVLDQDFVCAANALLAVLGFEQLQGPFLDSSNVRQERNNSVSMRV